MHLTGPSCWLEAAKSAKAAYLSSFDTGWLDGRAWTHARTGGRAGRQTGGRIDGRLDGRVDGWMHR